jgi:hypothetical protein
MVGMYIFCFYKKMEIKYYHKWKYSSSFHN